jgi:long-chain fatty acid transport protein
MRSATTSPFRLRLFALALVLALAPAHLARASGYAIKEQSGRLLGSAFAGAGSSAQDPSVLFFNPAGIAKLDGYRVSGVFSAIFARTDFDNDDSSLSGPTPPFPPGGIPIPGGDGGDVGKTAKVPTFYAAAQMPKPVDFLHLGLGVNAPFGLSTEYEDDWVGRYSALNSRLTTYNFNPVVAVQPLPWLSLGAGAQFQYADAELTRAIDFGSILAGLGAPGAVPFGADGKVELKADDWGFGYTVGALAEPWKGTRLGVSYRSYINEHLDGTAKFEDVPPPLAPSPLFTNQDATARVSTPDSVEISLHQDLGTRWAVMGDIQWTNWSRFQVLRVNFAEEGVPNQVVSEQWHDSWFYSIGAQYALFSSLTLRGGFAYDETPMSDDHRTAPLPDQDRFWLTAGASYQYNRLIGLNLGYAHIFVRDAEIDEETVVGGALTYRTHGKYQTAIDIVSVQLDLRF